MTMLRDEMSGKNDPYKKPAGYDLHITGSKEQQAALANMMLGNPVMTGQEWYDRFLAELSGYSSLQIHTVDWGEVSDLLNREIVIVAARQAAGLTDKENET